MAIKGYEKTYDINKNCVASRSAEALLHDDLFSSMLGMLSIDTQVHDKQLDIFSSCKSTQIVKR